MAIDDVKDIWITHFAVKTESSENGITEMSKDSGSAQFEVIHPLFGKQLLLKSERCLYLIY
jgi:hypothetical protein